MPRRSAGAPEAPPRRLWNERLPLQVHQLLQHLVGGGDDTSVRLESALRDDHVGELLRNVHVRSFERTRGDRGRDRASREPDHGAAGVRGLEVRVVAVAQQARRVGELGQGDLRDKPGEAIRFALGSGALDAFTIGAETKAEQNNLVQHIAAA